MSWPPFDSPCLTPPTESPGPLGPCLHCQIRHLAICGVLTPAEVQAMDAVASLQVLEAGAVLARQGEPRRHVYTVTQGALRLVRLSADG
nr:cyclic nucleotide-binding domain-containing protein [Pseudoxanthomonas sp.]